MWQRFTGSIFLTACCFLRCNLSRYITPAFEVHCTHIKAGCLLASSPPVREQRFCFLTITVVTSVTANGTLRARMQANRLFTGCTASSTVWDHILERIGSSPFWLQERLAQSYMALFSLAFQNVCTKIHSASPLDPASLCTSSTPRPTRN